MKVATFGTAKDLRQLILDSNFQRLRKDSSIFGNNWTVSGSYPGWTQNIITIPTRLRLRPEIQNNTLRAEDDVQLGSGPRTCTNFVERTWRTKLHSSKQSWPEASTATVNPDEIELIVDSGVPMHMMRTQKMSRLHTTVITANGSTEEAKSERQAWTCSSRSDPLKTIQRYGFWEHFVKSMCIRISGKKVKHQIYFIMARWYPASTIASCPSSFLVDPVKHTLRVQQKIRLT